MQDLVQFVIQHWFLSSLLIILLILLFIEEARTKGLFGQLSPQGLVQLINHESAVVVDIRNHEAFQEGHIVGSINMPQMELEKDLTPLNKYKDRTMVVVCQAGQKAGGLAMKMKKQNFERVQILSGGINAWKNAQMPLVKK